MSLVMLIAVGAVVLVVIAVVLVATTRRDATVAPLVPPQASLPQASPPEQIDSRLLPLLQAGQKIEAIKLARELTGLGLKEAKDYVGALEQRGG
jgi:ribosomal protein L7/L12